MEFDKSEGYRPYYSVKEMLEDYKKRFKTKDRIPLIWLRDKFYLDDIGLIVSFGITTVCITDVGYSLEEVFDKFVYIDETPCGVKNE